MLGYKTMYTRDRAIESINKNREGSCCHVNHLRIHRGIVHEYTHTRVCVSRLLAICMSFPMDYQKFMRSKASKSSKLAVQDLWDFISFSLSISVSRSRLLQRLTQRNMHASTVNDARPSPFRLRSPLSRLYAMRLA